MSDHMLTAAGWFAIGAVTGGSLVRALAMVQVRALMARIAEAEGRIGNITKGLRQVELEVDR